MSVLTERAKLAPGSLFSRVLVGIDSSEESREAALQAAVLAEGQLTLLAVYGVRADFGAGTPIGIPVYYDGDLDREAAEDALSRVREDIAAADPSGKVVRGVVWDALLREAEDEQQTLIAVGSHGVGRIAGITLGAVATNVIHKAPCSVLVARKRSDAFPRKIVVGVDGSPESAAAYAVAKQLSDRFETELVAVVAHGDQPVERELIDPLIGRYREDLPDEPVQALVAAAADADLLVVGSRGLHGLKALGSVSEQVAHRARSSVLIVREPTRERTNPEPLQ